MQWYIGIHFPSTRSNFHLRGCHLLTINFLRSVQIGVDGQLLLSEQGCLPPDLALVTSLARILKMLSHVAKVVIRQSLQALAKDTFH